MRVVQQIKGFVYFFENDRLQTGFNYLIKYPQLVYPMVGYKGRVLGVVKFSSLIYAVSTLQSHATTLKMYVYGDYPVVQSYLRKEKLLEIFKDEPFLWCMQLAENNGFAGLTLGSKLLQEGIAAGKIGTLEISKFSQLYGEEFYKVLEILDKGQISFLFKKFLMLASYKAFNFKEVYPFLNLANYEEKIIELSLKLNNGQKAELAKMSGFKRSNLYQQLRRVNEKGEER
ncbi:hypothetical protein [Carboxydothermus pertinax]|uniref:Uncharacterized protein n=1 Tax=Carboxydothermus pertinax TaxID=870242 RepID=A0A1L8CTJ2_9THEO|nr:hypothetical protein [Carboxydothermus pertinax]GAV22241.1 hypothetical protein cpu_07510 [Carboxydothermus pertinax]